MQQKKMILIADDDKDLLDILSTRCRQLGLDVITAYDAMTALSCADFAMPDLVCLDVNMPAGNGLSVCEMMATDSRLSSVPVIIMTGRADETVERRCHDMAAYFVPKSANTWDRLKPLICDLLEIDTASSAGTEGAPEGQIIEPLADTPSADCIDLVFSALHQEPALPGLAEDEERTQQDAPWILSIDDDSDFSFGLKVRLAEKGIDLLRAFEGMEGYRNAFTSQVHAILLDYEMPDVNGDYVLRRLKENPLTEHVPVIVLTGHRDNALKRKLFNMGAAAFLTKPVRWDDLWNELQTHLPLREPATT